MKHTCICTVALAAMLASAPAAKADFTTNLLTGWTFNTANSGSLTSDLGTLSATFQEKSIGTSPTTTYNSDGTVSLSYSRELVATEINSSSLSVADGITIWARVKFDSVASGTGVFGLVNANEPIAAANKNIDRSATFSLLNASGSSSTSYFYGTSEAAGGATAGLAPGSGFHTVDTTGYYNIAIRVNDTGSTTSVYSSWVNGSTTSRTWNGSTSDLRAFQSFALGRLIDAAGAGYTFDEVRIYNALLTDANLSEISAVSVPEPASSAVVLGLAGLAVTWVAGRRRGQGE